MVSYSLSRFFINPGRLLNYIATLKRLIMKTENLMKTDKEKVRQRLFSIYKQHGKITERELLRISALTGINYSTVVEIMRECKLG